MSNFNINPAMTPNLQTQAEIPFLNSTSKQTGFQESDFSKALKAASKSWQKEERSEIPVTNKQEFNSSKEISRERKQPVAEKKDQPNRQETEVVASEKQPVSNSEQNAADQNGKTNQQNKNEETTNAVAVEPKNPETPDQSETDSAQVSAMAQLLMEMVDNSQHIVESVETAGNLTESKVVTAITEPGILTDAITAPTTEAANSKQTTQINDLTAKAEAADNQTSVDNNFLKTLTGQVDQNKQSILQSANTPVAEAVQTGESLASLNGVKTIKQQSIKIEDNNEMKFAEAVNGDVKDAKPLTTGTGIAESQLKNGNQKDLLSSELAKAMNTGKKEEGSEAQIKNESSADSSAVIQTLAKDGKPHSLNLPLIQTQLSVNGNADKTRTDMPVLQITPHQQNMQATTEVTGTTTNNVQREELFAQIIDKAKIMVNNGHSEMEVSLKPDHLGKLQLKVSVDNQVVTAKFVAESQQVKEIIETNLNHLRRNLQETGVQVDQIMVSVGQQQNGGNFQETGNYHGGFNNGNNYLSHDGEIESSLEKEVQENRPVSETLVDLIA